MKWNKRAGLIVMIMSAGLSVISLLLSKGYYPEAGFIYGILNSINLFEGSIVDGWISSSPCDYYGCVEFLVLTKYVLSLLLMVFIFGLLLYLELISIKNAKDKD